MRHRLHRSFLVVGLAVLTTPAPAEACAWDNETYFAEATKLPCVADVLLGYTTPHTPEYYEARLRAMDLALDVVPWWLEGLDAKGVALLRLGRLDEAEVVMKQRLEWVPAAYAGHANLGTLYTFTGELELAKTHIEAAMEIEPDAHFGREAVHLAFVDHLLAVAADPGLVGTNFLGLQLTKAQRLDGGPGKLKAAGRTPHDIDAIVAMLTVYGAADHPDLLYALGDLLALDGMTRLAWTAYRRARASGHPNTRELYRLEKALSDKLEAEWEADPERRPSELEYGKLAGVYRSTQGYAETFRDKYAKWEREQLGAGLKVWTAEGLATLYEGMETKRPRCPVTPVPGDSKSATGTPAAADAAAPGDAR